ncbi:hypothetical protein LSTR_LSTR003399 [Laodelphax striatellus]|uniref:Uncharacterized protein n=1 Tax=Laodelphax striatellus TaxID=195883 RepID=A0A482X4U3_LAOST|nr:hypothetical protein LSTR_LSTR003399 [Laodelphax striatellus]
MVRRDSHITVTVITALSIEVCQWCKTMPHACTPTYTCKSSSYAQAGLTAREDLLKMPAATVVCSSCGAENYKVHRDRIEGEEKEERRKRNDKEGGTSRKEPTSHMAMEEKVGEWRNYAL